MSSCPGRCRGERAWLTLTYSYGYALLVGVGRCQTRRWSLLVTVRDVRAIGGVLTDPDLCSYPADPGKPALVAAEFAAPPGRSRNAPRNVAGFISIESVR
jgi:hypothetical protein